MIFVLEKEEKGTKQYLLQVIFFNPVCHSRSQGFRTILCGRNSDCKVEQLQYIPEKKKTTYGPILSQVSSKSLPQHFVGPFGGFHVWRL